MKVVILLVFKILKSRNQKFEDEKRSVCDSKFLEIYIVKY